jgi:hypothetical protein
MSYHNKYPKMSKRRRREIQIADDQRRYRMCSTKKGWKTEIEALAWGKISNDINHMDRHFRAYYCDYCYKFHLTTKIKGIHKVEEMEMA